MLNKKIQSPLDGSGVHCGFDKNNNLNSQFSESKIINIEKLEITIKQSIINQIKNNLTKNNITLKRKLISFVAPELIQFYRRKLKNKTKRQLLKELPRFTETKVDLLGREITIPDSASYLFMHKEIFKQNIYKFKTTSKTPYFIDGGANIGLATIYLKKLFPNSEIVAFEPDPYIYNILSNNIKCFNFENIKLIKKGLWNEDKTLNFHSEGADGGIITELNDKKSFSNSIEVTSLKSFINKKVDFLKIDIEGAETIVLKDIEDKLDKVERIFVEYHSFVDQKQSLNEIINILTKANFRLYMSIPGDNSIKSPLMGYGNYNNMDFQLNIFGYKQSEILAE